MDEQANIDTHQNHNLQRTPSFVGSLSHNSSPSSSTSNPPPSNSNPPTNGQVIDPLFRRKPKLDAEIDFKKSFSEKQIEEAIDKQVQVRGK